MHIIACTPMVTCRTLSIRKTTVLTRNSYTRSEKIQNNTVLRALLEPQQEKGVKRNGV